jgi:hypothetical protein
MTEEMRHSSFLILPSSAATHRHTTSFVLDYTPAVLILSQGRENGRIFISTERVRSAPVPTNDLNTSSFHLPSYAAIQQQKLIVFVDAPLPPQDTLANLIIWRGRANRWSLANFSLIITKRVGIEQ